MKCVARIAPTPIMMSASLREIPRNGRRRSRKANGARIRDASASRYRAIVMNGDVLQEMKIAEKETLTTARAIAA